MPNGTVILNHYKQYRETHDLGDDDMQMLFHFFHEIVACVNLMWRKIFEGRNIFKCGYSIRQSILLFKL